jgi:pyruvate carboxylase subunit B
MMLLRGQNLVQYTSFPDDVVEAFVRCTAAHGLDVFRIFDALNDARNLRTPLRAVKAAGKHAQGAICYTISPVHTPAKLAAFADELVELGSDSICIKDMAGLLTPRVTYNLVKAIKHRHSSRWSSTATTRRASHWPPTSPPSTRAPTRWRPPSRRSPTARRSRTRSACWPRWRATRGSPVTTPRSLFELRQYFEGVAKELAAFMSPANERVDSDALTFQVPGRDAQQLPEPASGNEDGESQVSRKSWPRFPSFARRSVGSRW